MDARRHAMPAVAFRYRATDFKSRATGIMEAELAGVVRYTHYSLMVFGHNRLPILSCLREEATTCLAPCERRG